MAIYKMQCNIVIMLYNNSNILIIIIIILLRKLMNPESPSSYFSVPPSQYNAMAFSGYFLKPLFDMDER